MNDPISIRIERRPLKSGGMANYITKSVPGTDVPEKLIRRLRGAVKGVNFSLEQIDEFKETAGVHLMAIEWEHSIPEIAERAGMLPQPIVS
jgi:methylenetetrahydrofolate reductase (NADPH)